jgi:2-polyprenyl-3-methyl-5-hydroxy-6-metoxy-1,4-benzoquinol methylase
VKNKSGITDDLVQYMSNLFNKDYFYGRRSNYTNYENLKRESIWIDKIRKLLKYKRKGKLLDVGCAFGYFALYVKEEVLMFME